ncbi:hypothetical protein TNCT_667581 [Trichonephila clavata]|uniref:Uncharacterized protein n=1 Tax=Trichonephila clavata TaxID=2740835 RepID=A0A8X6HSJ8_TRICU|nr:hypothetical protein TNCT_667581 [Trichonephila clavata]
MRIRCRLCRTDRNSVTPVKFFTRTELSVKKVNFLWDIERFSFLKSGEKVDFVLRSESEDDEVTFSLRVNEADRISISIVSVKKDVKFLIFQPFMTDTNGCKIDCGRCEISPNEIQNATCMLPLTKKYLKDNKNLYLQNDVLSLHRIFLERWI